MQCSWGMAMKFKTGTIILSTVLIVTTGTQAQRLKLSRLDLGGMTHTEWVMQVLFTPDGKQIVSAGLDGRIRLWNSADGKIEMELVAENPAPLLALAISPNGKLIATGDTRGRVHLWNKISKQSLHVLQVSKKQVNSVAFSPDGQYVVSGGGDGKVQIWRFADETRVTEIDPDDGPIADTVFLTTERLAIGTLGNPARGQRGSVGVWEWVSAKRLLDFRDGTPAVRSLTSSSDGILLAVAGFEKAVSLYIIPTGEKTAEISTRLIPESDESSSIAVWNLSSGELQGVYEIDLGARSLVFSPDGSMIAAAGDRGVTIFKVAARSVLEMGTINTRRRIDSVAFSPDGQQLVFAREEWGILEGNEGPIAGVQDPSRVRMGMVAWDGSGPSITEVPSSSTVTGGATIELWSMRQLSEPEDVRFWQTIRTLDENPDEARRQLEELISEFPHFVEAKRVLAVFHGEKGEFARAESLLQQATKENPDCANCYRTLGDYYFMQEKLTEAVTLYKRALAVDPRFGLVEGHLAMAYNRQGRSLLTPTADGESFEKGAKLFLEAIRLRPGESEYYSSFAAMFYFSEEFDHAIKIMKQGLEVRPDHARLYYNLGHAYRAKGENEKAVDAYKKYVALGEKGQEARVERAKRLIEELSDQE